MGYKGVSRLLAIVLASGFALALPLAIDAARLPTVTPGNRRQQGISR